MKKLWRPDLLFVNGKSERRHSVIRNNAFLDVDPSGEIMVSERLTLKLGCFMNLGMFPFDRQVCPVSIESMAHRYTKYESSS